MNHKDNFFEYLKDEIQNYVKDSQAEIGMGIYQIIIERRKILSDTILLDTVLNICQSLINKSPECALEFLKILGECNDK
jgi:hypothetical protein